MVQAQFSGLNNHWVDYRNPRKRRLNMCSTCDVIVSRIRPGTTAYYGPWRTSWPRPSSRSCPWLPRTPTSCTSAMRHMWGILSTLRKWGLWRPVLENLTGSEWELSPRSSSWRPTRTLGCSSTSGKVSSRLVDFFKWKCYCTRVANLSSLDCVLYLLFAELFPGLILSYRCFLDHPLP